MGAAKKKTKKSAARGGMSTRKPPAVPKVHPETSALAKRLHAWLQVDSDERPELESLLTAVSDLLRSKADAIRLMRAAVVELAGDRITREQVPTALAALDAMHRGQLDDAEARVQRVIREIDTGDRHDESPGQFVLEVLCDWLGKQRAK